VQQLEGSGIVERALKSVLAGMFLFLAGLETAIAEELADALEVTGVAESASLAAADSAEAISLEEYVSACILETEVCDGCRKVPIAAAKSYKVVIDVLREASCESRFRLELAHVGLSTLLENEANQAVLRKVMLAEDEAYSGDYTEQQIDDYLEKIHKPDLSLDESQLKLGDDYELGQKPQSDDKNGDSAKLEDPAHALQAWISEANEAYRNDIRKLDFRHTVTTGTPAAISALRKGETTDLANPCTTSTLDDYVTASTAWFAIAQNDEVHYRWNGFIPGTDRKKENCDAFTELRKVMALFHGYIQVLSTPKVPQTCKDQDQIHHGESEAAGVLSIKELQDARYLWQISIGASGATLRHSRVLLEKLGLREYVDYTPLKLKSSEALCESGFNAFLRSSFLMKNDAVRHLPVPPNTIEFLLARHKYYSRTGVPDWFCTEYEQNNWSSFCEWIRYPDPQTGEPGSHRPLPSTFLSITTSLLTRKDVPEDLVSMVTRALVKNWDRLTELGRSNSSRLDLLPLVTEIRLSPVDYHPAAMEVIEEEGLLGDDSYVIRAAWASFVALFLVGLWLVFRRYAFQYDRMGISGSFTQTVPYAYRAILNSVTSIRLNRELARQLWETFAPFITITLAVVAAYVIVLALSINALKSLESAYAQANNTIDPLVGKTLWESLIWIFTFLVSGYEDEVFPSSDQGKILIAILALATLFIPIFTVTRIINLMMQNQELRHRGDASFRRLGGHTVICGWNAKAPGIIYSLTGRDAPRRNQVVVVAEISEEQPLVKYKFSPSLVHYVKGDSANAVALHRAGIENASHVIVLAGDMKRRHKNIGSALTALAVSEINPQASVSAELAYRQNKQYFERVEVAHVVDAEEISERMIALSCVVPLGVDFVLDVLSLDDFSEWYALTGEEIRKRFDKMSVQDLLRVASASRLNLVGLVCSEADSSEPDDSSHINLLLEREDLMRRIADDDIAIFAAEDARKLKKIIRSEPWSAESHWIDEQLLKDLTAKQRILLVGDATRAARLESLIENELPEPIIEIVDPGKFKSEPEIQQKIEAHLTRGDWDHIILLSAAMGDEVLEADQAYQQDATTVLRADLIDAITDKPSVIAELVDVNSRHLLKKAGVDIVVPGGLLAERLLTQRALGHGVPRMVMAIVERLEGYRLRQMKLICGHPLVGEQLSDVLTTQFADGRVLAVLPQSPPRDIQNLAQDFATHYLMCPLLDQDHKLEVGDEVLVVTRS